jgi:hypothetical protein
MVMNYVYGYVLAKDPASLLGIYLLNKVKMESKSIVWEIIADGGSVSLYAPPLKSRRLRLVKKSKL